VTVRGLCKSSSASPICQTHGVHGFRCPNAAASMDMLAELRDDNKQLVANLRETHGLCDGHDDVATASLLEVWIDEAERRTWFLFEATRTNEP
jgi:Ferritin-like domain